MFYKIVYFLYRKLLADCEGREYKAESNEKAEPTRSRWAFWVTLL